jgi:hypothetical protein
MEWSLFGWSVLKNKKIKVAKDATYSGFEIKSVLQPGFPSFM